MTPNSCPALLLNADYRPMGIFPLSLLGWQDAVKAVIAGRVDTIGEYDREVRSQGGFSMRLPSVLALRDYQRMDRPVAFTRAAVMLRARGRCAYCSTRLTMRELTFDHVHPQSKGGRTNWTNVVAACEPCNARKASKTLGQCGMALVHAPYVPTRQELNRIALSEWSVPMANVHPDWAPYLGVSGASATARIGGGRDRGGVFPDDMTSDDYLNVELEE